MALINCPDCGAEVSDAAPACPKCGRPIASVPSPTNASDERTRGRSHATVTVTLSSFVLIVLAIAAAVWFVPSMEIGQNLEARCQVNGMGNGACQFTNTGWTPGAQCVDVSLRNKQGSAAHSGAVCSGRVWPNDTVQKNVMIAIGNTCDNGLGVPDLSDVCTMDVNNADSDDAGAGPPSTEGAAQPSTDAANADPQSSAGNTDAIVPSAASASAAVNDNPDETPVLPAASSSAATATTAANASDQNQPAVSAASIAQAAAGTPGESASSLAPPASGSSVPEVLQAVIAKTAGPSFDCSKATSATALAICGNADLSELDRQMAIDYYTRTNYATDETVRDAQRAWIRARNACQTDVACLQQAYSLRIQQLQQGTSL